MASQRIKGITIKIGADTTELSKAIRTFEKDVNSAKTSLRDINRLLKADPKNAELLAQKQKAFNQAIDATKQKLEQEKEALRQLESADQTDDVVRQQENLKREIIYTEQELNKLEQEYKEFGSVAKQQTKVAAEQMQAAGQKIQDYGQGMVNAGRGLTTYVTAPIVAAGTASFMNYAEVSKTLALANQTMGNTTEQANKLSQAMQDAASKSTFGMNDAAQAALNFARAGLSAEQAAAAIGPAMNLAAGEAGDLDTVSAGLVGTINGFQDTFDKSGKYADIFAAACNNSALEINSMMDSMGIAAPVFNTAGYEIRDAALYMGIMANNEIEANVAANALKTGLGRLVEPAKAGQMALEKLGLQTSDAMGNISRAYINADGSMKSTIEVQKILHDSFKDLSETEKIAAAQAIFGKNQYASWLALIQTAPEDVQKLNKALLESAGTTDEMAAAMMSGTGGSIEQLKSSIDVLGYSFGELIAKYINPLIEKLQGLIDKLNAMDPQTKDMVIRISAIVAAVGPLLMLIGSIVVAIGKMVWAIGTIKGALAGGSLLSGLSGSLGSAGAAATGATGAMGGLGAAIAGLLGPIALVAAAIAVWVINWEQIKEAGALLVERTKEHLETIKEDWINVCDAVAEYAPAKFNEIKENVLTIISLLKEGILYDLDFLTQGIQQKINFVKEVVLGLLNGDLLAKAKQWGSDLINNIKDGIEAGIGKVKEACNKVGQAIKERLHFSEPDIGPLSDFNTWMPDMMKQMASQINAGIPGVENAMNNAAGAIKNEIDYSTQLASINNGIGKLASASGGTIEVPVTMYLNNTKFGQAVASANINNNYRSGGR